MDIEANTVVLANGKEVDDKLSKEDGEKKEEEVPEETVSFIEYVSGMCSSNSTTILRGGGTSEAGPL